MVSIIIPVYNVGLYLTNCLESCIQQSYREIEIIAVNDGSTDNSANILNEYLSKDDRIKVIHQKNKGVVIARETALNFAKGDYVIFVDSDDYIEKEMIGLLVSEAESSNSDIVICNFNICEENGNIIQRRLNKVSGHTKENALSSLLLRDCTWSLCGKLFKKSLFKSIIMPYGLKMGEDGIVCFQLFEKSNKITTINIELYNYVQRKTSVTHQANIDNSKSIVKFLNAVEEFIGNNKTDVKINDYLSFVGSQIFVYYLIGGDRECINSIIPKELTISKILTLKLKIKEKVGLILFLYLYRTSIFLRCLYQLCRPQ